VAAHEAAIRTAWAAHVAEGSPAIQALERLLARHREAHRRYHGVAHVGWVIQLVIELAGQVPGVDVDIAVAAACFHDAVYDPRSSTNEAASARLAERTLAELGWAADRVARVAAAVEATADHDCGDDPTTAVLLDADLSILGADPAGYADYATGVRAEYAHLDEATWQAGRTAVLQSLLARPRLYVTDVAHDRFEHRARANLTAELAALTANAVDVDPAGPAPGRVRR
jgi:predicted metal-dependent HD superfamily phosphohydrolase